MLKNKDLMKKISITDKKRRKRDDQPSKFLKNQLNLFVDYLVVIDSSVYAIFFQQYGFLPISLITNYINIFFCHLINGVRPKFGLFYRYLILMR